MLFLNSKIVLLFTCIAICVCGKAKGNEPKKDTGAKSFVTKQQLVNIIDSLLDLESIDPLQIKLVNYYTSLLSLPENNIALALKSGIPATNVYDDFDENTVFKIVPESEFPDVQVLKIEADSFGYYHHPKIGDVTSVFGWRDGRLHKGIDIELKRGEPIVCAFDGMVRIAKAKGSFGNVVIVRHYNGLETVYAHLSKIKVKPGQIISAGQLIGLGGNTGRSSGPHLHFEVRYKGQAINPSSIICFNERGLFNDSITIKKTRYGICAYPSNATIHTIERGDTWYEVAKRYGHTLKELCLLNGTDKRYYLKIGQKLRVN